MLLAEPIAASWRGELSLEFTSRDAKTILSRRQHHGPLVVQKPFYPEGDEVCHAIIVHPPGGIAGGDELVLSAKVDGSALLTTPGAAKWYRSSGPWARQTIDFDVAGTLEWLPQESIFFDESFCDSTTEIRLAADARYIGWEILCLGRSGSGERFARGEIRLKTEVRRAGRLVRFERARIEGGGALMDSPVGLGGNTVCGTFIAAVPGIQKTLVEGLAVTRLPDLLIARYLGNSSEQAKNLFIQLWTAIRPASLGRPASAPRIWST